MLLLIAFMLPTTFQNTQYSNIPPRTFRRRYLPGRMAEREHDEASKGRFAPKDPPKLNAPIFDPISIEQLSQCDGEIYAHIENTAGINVLII